MKHPIFFLACLAGLVAKAFGFEGRTPYGAGLGSLGGSVVALAADDAVSFNPSSLAFMDRKSLMISGHHSLEERQTFQCLAILPTAVAGFAAGLGRTTVSEIALKDELNNDCGRSEFVSQKITLASAFHFGKNLAFGSGMNILSTSLGEERIESRLLFDFGLISRLNKWNIGMAFLHWGDEGEMRSPEFRLGSAKEGKMTFSAEMVWPLKETPYPLFSMSYRFFEQFEARSALHCGPQDLKRLGLISGFSFGFVIHHKGFSFEYAPVFEGSGEGEGLGWSHKFALTYKGTGKTKRESKPNLKSAAIAENEKSIPPPPDLSAFSPGGESREDWRNFVQEVKSCFSVLSREVAVKEEKESLILELKNVSCRSGRFSMQSGAILAQTAKLLKNYGHFLLLIEGSGPPEESDSPEIIRTFLYNERLDMGRMKTKFSAGESLTRLIVVGAFKDEP